ncbi:TrbC family F-type conjugative pilus assembly protein [Vibrio mediterranei]|uniref:TrbC family F-type conjugative pilus assembly protein n=1 Tax=Vibrio mediterranei TaxID=689 RepID=UPI0040687C86
MVRALKHSALLISSIVAMHSHTSSATAAYDIASSKATAIEQGTALLTDDYISQLITSSESLVRSHTSEEPHSFFETQRHYQILMSASMGDENIRNLLMAYKHRQDVSFVIRGLLPNERTITDAGLRIIRLVADFDTVPNVSLDPRPFKAISAEYVPYVLAYDGDRLISYASGLTNVQWIADQEKHGKKGFLGNYGAMVKIAERDLEDILRERFEALDKQALIQGAKDRFWDNRQYLSLPKVQKTQRRTFSPDLLLQQDVITEEGYVIALKGQAFNTLEHMPFTQRLVVFDATDKAQLEYVKALPDSHLRTKYITTKFDNSLKWDAVKSVERYLDAEVFQLNSDIINAFDVRAVPSIVTANNQQKVFIIDEVRVEGVR